MPQMMPINWMISLLFFISIFISFMVMNYFIFNYKINFNLKKINNLVVKKKSWKW